jgi:hypothetical protein
MSCLGVHFALSNEDVALLKAFKSEEARLEHLQEVIEEDYMSDDGPDAMYAENDKAWDAMHRVLADGRLTWDGGSYPLNHAVLAGELLYTGSDYIMSLKSSEQVKDIATALAGIDFSAFSERYRKIDAEDYDFPLTDEDLEYTWEWFQSVRDLYSRAAANDRPVLFTADQ